MLTGISVRDFAIIDELEVHLDTGMTVLTGETGAGKSILVDALGLLLGGRADAGNVRHGTERAEISAEFDLRRLPAARAWLKSQDLAEDGECLLRRSLGHDGRSRNYINGRSATLSQLRELGEQLVDIHGQHEHQTLLHAATQLGLLDDYADNAQLLTPLAQTHAQAGAVSERLDALRAAAADRDARLELLRHQVSELEALGLQAGELEAIEIEHRRLANGSRLIEGARAALETVYENEDLSAHQLTHQALNSLTALVELDERLKPICDALNSAEAQLEDAGSSLRRYLANSDLDPERLAAVENRMGAIHDLARKHRIEAQRLPDLLVRLQSELKALENNAVALQELENEARRLRDQYHKAAEQLHQRRENAAAALAGKVTRIMRELGMPAGRFSIELNYDPARFGVRGGDSADFQISTNPGEPPQALTQVASGGELSRIALAIEVAAARASTIPTLIFDEVDAGIGGGVAEIVGHYLRELGATRQVLCVTHLPQVASQAQQHFRVSKHTGAHRAVTQIENLDQSNRVEELARMLGGVKITETTRQHAREMLARGTRT